jgi:hypothetical protein
LIDHAHNVSQNAKRKKKGKASKQEPPKNQSSAQRRSSPPSQPVVCVFFLLLHYPSVRFFFGFLLPPSFSQIIRFPWRLWAESFCF